MLHCKILNFPLLRACSEKDHSLGCVWLSWVGTCALARVCRGLVPSLPIRSTSVWNTIGDKNMARKFDCSVCVLCWWSSSIHQLGFLVSELSSSVRELSSSVRELSSSAQFANSATQLSSQTQQLSSLVLALA